MHIRMRNIKGEVMAAWSYMVELRWVRLFHSIYVFSIHFFAFILCFSSFPFSLNGIK